MKLDRKKFELARARACMGQKDFEKSRNPKRNIMQGNERQKFEAGNSWKDCKGFGSGCN